MAIKVYCDTCFNEIKPKELIAEFASMEVKLKNNGQPEMVKYTLCEVCRKEVKATIFKLLEKKDGK